ncbi:MAG: hypothetical protein KBC17_01095 [Candidatus Pacebacteria bacterium]|nr:hypothetical protein [Candidatus Paceibacterota bacterium]
MKFITIIPGNEGGFAAMIEGKPETTVGGLDKNEAIVNLLEKYGEDYFNLMILEKKE